MIVLIFGTFDLLHPGHVNLLKTCKFLNGEPERNKLIVGVSSDRFSFEKKNRFPIISEHQRKMMLEAIRYVDEVFLEESFEKKRQYILSYKADVLVMGDDWKGKFDEFNDICKVVYLPRTPSISTTYLIEVCQDVTR